MNLKRLMDNKKNNISKREMVKMARQLLARQMSMVGYGERYDEYVEKVGDADLAESIMFEQMKKACKAIGEEAYW